MIIKDNDMIEPIYIETWEVVGSPKGNRLDISYTKSMCPTDEAIDMYRRDMAETYKCELRKLLKMRII